MRGFGEPGSKLMEPLVNGVNPSIILRIVDLPQPDGPTIVTNSPGRNERSSPSMILRSSS